jgi:hypothetical protein
MKKVKYKTTTSFGALGKGIIIDAYMICNDLGDDDKALIYHPKNEKENFNCSSLEFCYFNHRSKAYESCGKDSYINITSQADKIFIKKASPSKEEVSKEKLKSKLLKIKNIVKDTDI